MPGVCPRCSRNVFFAEQKFALGKVWHIHCFSCQNCRKLLDSWTVVIHNDELFCQSCYAHLLASAKQNGPTEKLKHLYHEQPSYCCCCPVSYEAGDPWRQDSEVHSEKCNIDGVKSVASFGIDMTNSNCHCSVSSVDRPSCYSPRNFHKPVESQISIDQHQQPETRSHKPNLNSNHQLHTSTPQVDLQDHKSRTMCCLHCQLPSPEACSSIEPHMIRSRRVSFQDNVDNASACCSHRKLSNYDILTIVEDINECVPAIEAPVQGQDNRLRGGSRCHSCSRDEYAGCCCSSSSSSKRFCCTSRSSHDSGCRRSRGGSHDHFEDSIASMGDTQADGSYGSSSCQGRCSNPGQTSMPRRSCQTPPSSSHHREAFYPPVVRPDSCPRCRSVDREDSGSDVGPGRSPVGCEYFGGGLDCQRCGRKVYHAEMQMVSGSPYHNICFSCFCCRKPLETLTYHESCGEIYCKQCYVRNFGPQGYGYSGVLQTPI